LSRDILRHKKNEFDFLFTIFCKVAIIHTVEKVIIAAQGVSETFHIIT